MEGKSPHQQTSSNELSHAIRKLLYRLSQNCKTISQTFYSPVRFSSAIETKDNWIIDGRELSIWIGTRIAQMHHFRTVALEKELER